LAGNVILRYLYRCWQGARPVQHGAGTHPTPPEPPSPEPLDLERSLERLARETHSRPRPSNLAWVRASTSQSPSLASWSSSTHDGGAAKVSPQACSRPIECCGRRGMDTRNYGKFHPRFRAERFQGGGPVSPVAGAAAPPTIALPSRPPAGPPLLPQARRPDVEQPIGPGNVLQGAAGPRRPPPKGWSSATVRRWNSGDRDFSPN
jgi:hypothetical protein